MIMEKSQSITELTKALIKFQSQMRTLPRPKTVTVKTDRGTYAYSYAPLDVIMDVIREPLSNHGLSISQFPSGQNQLTTILMHVSGEYIFDTAEIPLTSKRAQDVGSALTYMRRYALSAVLGIVTDDDTDGKTSKKESKDKATQEQRDEIDALAEEAGLTKAKLAAMFRERYGVSITEMTPVQAQGVAEGLKSRIANSKK